MKRFLVFGTVAGTLLVVGEGILNGLLLKVEWLEMNLRLGLAEPSSTVVAFALIKLFALGFALAWLHGLARAKYGKDTKAALSAGFFVGLLIWGWALAGLLLAGYVNMAIALPTFLWGMVELPVVALAAARVSSRFVGGA